MDFLKREYHSWKHVTGVAHDARALALDAKLSEHWVNNILIACYFHDVGLHIGSRGHEMESARIARDFLRNKIDAGRIEEICSLIHATQLSKSPQNIHEMIMRDADLAYAGKSWEAFDYWSRALFREWSATREFEGSKLDWMARTHKFFSKHAYFTDYANRRWAHAKSRNLAVLNNDVQRLRSGKKWLKVKQEKPKKPRNNPKK